MCISRYLFLSATPKALLNANARPYRSERQASMLEERISVTRLNNRL